MRVYLDNCCYNRPFDDQMQLRVRFEIEAKLRVQYLMRTGAVEYVWSDMLSLEVGDNPVRMRREKILEWVAGAVANVEITDDIRADARELMARGLKNADALHLACAAAVDSDWFLTVDKGILKKVDAFKVTRVANPVDFILEYDYEDD